MKVGLFVLGLGTAGAVANSVEGHPLTPAIKEVIKLKQQLKYDEESDTRLYNKWACWVENTMKAKKTSMGDAWTTIQELTGDIVGHAATMVSKAEFLKTNAGDMKANMEEQKILVQDRQTSNAEYQTNMSELREVMMALQKSITLIRGRLGGSTSFLQQTAFLDAAPGVAKAIRKTTLVFSDEQMAQLKSFITDPAAPQFLQVQAGGASKTAPMIADTLEAMLEEFKNQEDSANATEKTQRDTFFESMDLKAQGLEDLKVQKLEAEDELAEAAKKRGAAIKARQETKEQAEADEALFEATKERANEVHAIWQAKLTRMGKEMEAIENCLTVLNELKESGNMDNGPGTQLGFFLQLNSDSNAVDAVTYLTQMYNQRPTKKMAAIIASIKALYKSSMKSNAKLGNERFATVIGIIKEMIEQLKTDASDDIEQLKTCNEQESEHTLKISDLEFQIKKETKASERAQAKIDMLEAKIEKLNEEISEADNALTEARGTRTEENSAYLTEKQKMEDSIAALKIAIGHLKAFYKPEEGSELAEPLEEVEENKGLNARMPGVDFARGKTNRKTLSGGPITMLENIVTSCERQCDDSKDEEEAALKEFTEFESQTEAAKISKEATIATLNGDLETEQAKVGDSGSITTLINTHESDLEAKKQSYQSFKGGCDWLAKHSEERATKRTAEMKGLNHVLVLLGDKKSE